MCPLLATTEQTHVNGLVNLGTLTSPMVYFMQCDNDGLYNNTFQYSRHRHVHRPHGPVRGPIDINIRHASSARSSKAPPSTTTSRCRAARRICYNQTVIDNCTSDSLRTTTVTAVPGSWQQLSNN